MTQPDGGQSPYDPPQQPDQGGQAPGSVPGQPTPYDQPAASAPYGQPGQPGQPGRPGPTPYGQEPYGQSPAQPAYAGQPGPYGAAPLPKNGLGVWSLVLGILAVLGCGILTGIAAIILGHKSRRAQREGEADNGAMGLAGIITGWVGIAWTTITVGLFVAATVFTLNDPAVRDGLEQLDTYQQENGQLPTSDPELEELLEQLENG